MIIFQIEEIAMAKETDKQKECFVIMPITVPEHMLKKYRDGKDHFNHVLDSLFIPAVEKAGYKTVLPRVKGSDFIHSIIITNLQTTDLVLCDMSALNANVFFELGVRTALNKPVCVVKDALIKAPFDTGVLQYHEYLSTLNSWDKDNEIKKLTEHINESAKLSEGQNNLWKKLGLKSEATPYEAESPTDAKLDYLQLQVDSIASKLDEVRDTKTGYKPLLEHSEENFRLNVDVLLQRLSMLLLDLGVSITRVDAIPEESTLALVLDNPINELLKKKLTNIAARNNIHLRVNCPISPEHS